MPECRDDRAIFDRAEEQWLREFPAGAIDAFDSFRENDIARHGPATGAGWRAGNIGARDDEAAASPIASIAAPKALTPSTHWP